MPDSKSPKPSQPSTPPERKAGSEARRPLDQRVRDRVVVAEQALERRDGAVRPRVRRSRPRSAAVPESPAHPALSREVRALRSVFHEFGVAHRRYRRRTGQTVAPGLRAAAEAFKQNPSLDSLVPVAGFLEDLDLLEW